MEKIIRILIFCLLVLSGSNADDNKTTTVKPTSTTILTSTTPSTVTPTTSNAPSSSTTTTTTSVAPPTTSTSVAPPTTTPSPEPNGPSSGTWVVNEKNHTCIIMKMTSKIVMQYLNTTNNNTINGVLYIPPPPISFNRGSCDEKNEMLEITWTNAKGSKNNTIVIHFEKSDKLYSIHNIIISIDNSNLPYSRFVDVVNFTNTQEYYNTSIGNSYRCARTQSFTLSSVDKKDNTTTASLIVTDLQFQAYRTDGTQQFGTAQDCATPDIVPIAVGCVLAGLVVVVLAAYLISRRRSQARGYLSM